MSNHDLRRFTTRKKKRYAMQSQLYGLDLIKYCKFHDDILKLKKSDEDFEAIFTDKEVESTQHDHSHGHGHGNDDNHGHSHMDEYEK
jgi:hypothetical protein